MSVCQPPHAVTTIYANYPPPTTRTRARGMRVTSLDDGSTRVAVDGWSLSDANAFRVALLQTTSLSASSCIVSENGGSFCDEFISHRISLLPLRKEVTVLDELSLDVVGPRVVLARDLVRKVKPSLGTESTESRSQSPQPKSPQSPQLHLPSPVVSEGENIILTLLAAGERLSLTAKIEAGSGARGAQFNHVVAARVVGGSGEDVGVVFEVLSSGDDACELAQAAMAIVRRGYG